MAKGLKIMFYWSFVFPILVTFFRISFDVLLGNEIVWMSHIAFFLATIFAGLIFGGPLNFLIFKYYAKKRVS
ncbi:hypothetical protein M3210_07355 [Oceanobacillus luteolus]|uniref:DUF2627 domain-containing protein n=1 Tax=Oceanobacillus luteolus TaxID=1274358 RepID=A0ABW4HNF1_9BACI|nr:hypothetical protein [Oceanobacillus luteolus]MCM3740084.1 hypothetical protein [Oceanobacillus luteolus]